MTYKMLDAQIMGRINLLRRIRIHLLGGAQPVPLRPHQRLARDFQSTRLYFTRAWGGVGSSVSPGFGVAAHTARAGIDTSDSRPGRAAIIATS